MAKQSSDKHIISFETKVGLNWKEQVISLSARTNVGLVLKEMKDQDVIRNVKLVQSAA